MAVLTLNAATPSEMDICNSSKFVVYANNTDPLASNIAINVTIPEGFVYQAGSTLISYPIDNISMQEPVIFGQYLNWTNSTWLLGNGETLKIEFNLMAGCKAPSGKRLVVSALYSGGSSQPFSSQSILVNQGLLKITKEPNVIEASKWDTVNWTVKIENLGTGPAFNVKVNDTNSTGLQLLSLDSPGGGLNWSYAEIAPGETKQVNTSFRVISCSNLVNQVNTSWGCGENDCQETYAKGSIKYVPKEPDLDYTFDPSPIVVPYCDKTWVNVSITNSGIGNATAVHLVFSEFNAPYAITNVSGAEYFEENHTFILGSLLDWQGVPAGSYKNISFDFAMPYQECDITGSSGVFNVNVHYYDDCGDEWFPPVSQIPYSMNESTIAQISATKISESGKDSLYLGESDDYTLTVNYQNGSCSSTLPDNTIIDHYPSNFEVVNAADGLVNDTNQTIIWNNQDLNSTTPWSKTIRLKVKDSGSCNCGGIYYNQFSVNASNDCCGCPLTANTSLPIIVKCFNTSVLSYSNKTAHPALQENCRLINYTNTYIINNSTSLRWADINFTEEGYNGQTFPDLSITGNASFNLNGFINISQITLNVSKNLSFLETELGPLQKGDVLKINYTLRQPNAGTFLDWSRLCVKGYNSGCAEVGCFQEETSVTVNQADYDIAILGVPSLISACKTFDLTINLSKNSPDGDPSWIAHNLSITYNDSNYRYIGPAFITDIVNQSGVVESFEPERVGSDLSWELGQNVSRGGNITFKVQLACPAEKDAFATLDYEDNCGGLVNRTASSSPSLLTFAKIYVEKTPEVIFALDRKASWKIYVTNTGSGPANNVTVVDDMQSGLNYTGSRISRCATCPFEEEASNTSLIDAEPCGPDKAIWNIGDMPPKKQVIIEVNATICGCQNLENNVYATVGCLGGECLNESASSQVELIDASILVSKHDAGLVDDCGANVPFSIEVRNSAAAYVYNLTIKEILPAGLKLNDTPVVSGAVNTSYDNSNPSILIWSFNQTQGISPGTRIAIKFNASVTGPCDFNGGDSALRLNYIEPCGSYGPAIESNIPMQKYQPLLTITKTPTFAIADKDDIINWKINISSTGDYEAKNISLLDVLPEGTIFHSASPIKNSGSGTQADPLVWNLANMTAGTKTTVYLNATVIECKTDKENNATVLWGCCSLRSNSTAKAKVRTSPAIFISSTNDSVDTCGGNYTINITNSGSTAYTANITDTLPAGFIYKTGSSNISSSLGSTFAIQEPVDNSSIDGTIIWNSTNIDEIKANETISIKFGIKNSPNSCGLETSSWNNLSFNFTDSCDFLHNNITADPITPARPNLQIKKVPKTQSVGAASWTITVNNTGTADAHNVTITEILGDGFKDISTTLTGTTIDDYPLAGWTTINWSDQTIPLGIDTWTVQVTANALPSGDLNNSVFIEGSCLGGCIYSQSSDQAYTARLNVTKEPDSIETIGDKVNFTISAEFWGVGEFYNETMINDTLPFGLEYYNWTCKSDSCGGCVPCGGIGNFSNTSFGSYSICSWKLGNFTGPRVVVINLSTIAKDVASNSAGTKILNRVDAIHEDDTGKSFQTYDTANVTLIEPLMNITKTNNVSGIAEVGEAINYSIEVYHIPTSQSTAYDVFINDTIPSGLNFVPGSNWSDPVDSFMISGQNLSWNYSSLNNITFNESNPVKLYYSALVNNTVVMGQILENNVTLTWTSTSGPNPDERYGGFNSLDNYNKTAISTLTVKNVASDIKLPHELRARTIGETANYTIIVSLPRAIARNLWINDTLPQGLKYDNDTLTISGATTKLANAPIIVYPANDGKQLSKINWSFGDVNNTLGQNLTIKFNVTVADVSSNRNNVLINENNATLVWTDFSGTVHNTYDLSGQIKVIEPLMNITKTNNVSGLAEVGEAINYSIEVYHIPTSQSTAYDVFINDTIPSGLNFVPGSNWSDPVDSFMISGQNLSWNYSSLNNITFNESNPVKLYYSALVNNTVVMGQILENNVTLTWTSTSGPNPDERYGGFNSLDNYNKTAISTLTVKNVAINITKKASPSSGAPSTNVDFTINVTNTGMVRLDHIKVIDSLPVGLNFVSANRSGSSSGQIVTWSDIGSLEPGNSTYLDLVAHINGLAYGELVNQINATGQPITGNNVTAESTEKVNAETAIINITKKASPSSGAPSTNVDFTINVTNTGMVRLNHIKVIDSLPVGLNFVSANRSGSSSGQIVTWSDIGSLEPGNSTYLDLVAHINGRAYGELVNQINATGQPITGNNVTAESTEKVNAETAFINITKKASPSSGAPSTNVDFTINVTNTGMVRLDHIKVIDSLPVGLNFVSANRSGSSSGQIVTWSDIGSLEPGNSTYLDLVAHINGRAYGELVNQINATGQPITGNNVTAESTEKVNAETAFINITKKASPSSGAPSTNVDFTINVTNTGMVRLDHIRVIDSLPVGLNFVSANRSGSSSGQIVTWSDIGSLEPGNSTYLDLVAYIDGTVYGSLNNYVNVTGRPPTGDNVTGDDTTTVQVLAKDMSNAIPEPVQFEQFCDTGKVTGSGMIEVSTSAIDKRIALDYSNAMAGEGDLEMISERAFSERAGDLKRNVTDKTMPLNFIEDTKVSYSGAIPIEGGKKLRSIEFYGGIGAEIDEEFTLNEMEKEQTLFFASTDPGSQVENQSQAGNLRNDSPVHLVGANTRNVFNGTWGMKSKWHEILKKDIVSSQVFTGRFEAEKTIKFHEAPVKGDTHKGCEGIDC